MSLVELAVREGVATVTLNDPTRRNAISLALAAELTAVCDAVDASEDIGAMVVRGAGDYFCSGAARDELGEIAADPYSDSARAALSSIYAAFTRVGAVRVPTVAAVRGGAVGAGLNLVLATDLCVISETATLRGFHQLRVHPGGGHLGLLLKACGPQVAAAVALFGETLTGRQAAEAGMGWSCVLDDEVESEADRLATAAAVDPWLARAVKASMAAESGPPAVAWAVGLEIERGPQLQSFARRSPQLAQPTGHRDPRQEEPEGMPQ